MALSTDDIIIPFLSSDGKLVAQKVTIASSTDDFVIPALSSDGKLIAVKVVSMASEDDIGTVALSSDGKKIAIKFEVTHVCSNCTNPVPDTLSVTLAGFTADGCDFDDLNGTFTVLNVSTRTPTNNPCIYGLSIERGVAVIGTGSGDDNIKPGEHGIVLRLNQNDIIVEASYFDSDGSGTTTVEFTSGAGTDCDDVGFPAFSYSVKSCVNGAGDCSGNPCSDTSGYTCSVAL